MNKREKRHLLFFGRYLRMALMFSTYLSILMVPRAEQRSFDMRLESMKSFSASLIVNDHVRRLVVFFMFPKISPVSLG